MNPARIYPPQYDLLSRRLPGIQPQVVTPYRHGEVVSYPADQPTVTVNHAEGQDSVAIETSGNPLAQYLAVLPGQGNQPSVAAPGAPGPVPPGPVEATGLSGNLRFDEAFADALGKLPPVAPSHPDALTHVEVVSIEGLFGGFAGFHHLAVRVRRTTD